MLGAASALYHSPKDDGTKIPKTLNVKALMEQKRKNEEAARKKREKEEARKKREKEEARKKLDIQTESTLNPSPSTSPDSEIKNNNEDEACFRVVDSESESKSVERPTTPTKVPFSHFQNSLSPQPEVKVSESKDRFFKGFMWFGGIILIVLFCIGLTIGVIVASGGRCL